MDALFNVRRSVLSGLVVLGLAASLAEGVGISLFIPLLHSLTPGSVADEGGGFVASVVEWTNRIDQENPLPWIVGAILVAVAVASSLAFGYRVVNGFVSARAGHRLRVRLFERIQRADYATLESAAYGRLLNAIATESWRAIEALKTLFMLYIAICTTSVYILLLLVLSWELTLVVAAGMLLISWIARSAARKIEWFGREATRINANLAQRISDGLGGILQIRAFNRERDEILHFKRTSSKVAKTFWKLDVLGNVVSPIFEILSALLIGGVLLFQFGSSEDLPALLVFLFVLYRLKPRIEEIETTRIKLSGMYGSVRELSEVMTLPQAPANEKGLTCESLESDLILEDVTFTYPGQNSPAIDHVSFVVRRGGTTAVVGQSGAGKTTLLKLLLRLYEPQRGAIRVGETLIHDYSMSSWRKTIGVVNQEAFLVDGSVAENIAYGDSSATREDVEDAARLAHAHDFILELPAGYETRVLERGVRLSAGQQQRILLARALVRRPSLLILDEATNNLDPLSERLVQEALENLAGERTVLVVAHRLSTIEGADEIVVLEGGLVVERGTFQELMRLRAHFWRMYESQDVRAATGAR